MGPYLGCATHLPLRDVAEATHMRILHVRAMACGVRLMNTPLFYHSHTNLVPHGRLGWPRR